MDPQENINWNTMERVPSEPEPVDVGLVSQSVVPADPAAAPSTTYAAQEVAPVSDPIPTSAPPQREVEWVACDTCEKWHELPTFVSASSLPDIWHCHNNTWNSSQAFCQQADALPQTFNEPAEPPPAKEEPPRILYRDDLEEEEEEEEEPEPTNDDDDEEYTDKNYYKKKKKKQRTE
ncbi:hypothetical protein TrLO_g12559 [Triparma laevis f. longispina]|uniref:CW-type domain-containing protein n=1 Tax=Triparma laevis f. longispina TaxID=1714387 RepID=A0A9W6ZYM4_9STRA|nr:hypothetical protein TrLO_g12559 [Triparma laevis f. longispina]